MECQNNLYNKLCTYENLEFAFKKARKRKTLKPYVILFEKNLREILLNLRTELLFHTYNPMPLKTFVLRDPKTRKISKSEFRDRVVHHALCNIIEPIFDKTFIYDSYANRIGKGTFKAIERFDYFKRKVSRNNTKTCYVLKADIKHYFEAVSHDILIATIKKRIDDKRVLWLIRAILSNHNTIEKGKGMPLGNLTSQFFANVYLNALDQFVKHKLKAKFYIRYVDNFVILHNIREMLEEYKSKINIFLKENLKLELHPDKSKIIQLDNGIGFFGVRLFFHHKLVRKKNIGNFEKKFEASKELYFKGIISREKVLGQFEGWLAYISNADTYKYRRHLTRMFNQYFPVEKVNKIENIKKHENFIEKIESSNSQFSTQKTLYLFKKGLTIKEIAIRRKIKESTVWEHFAKLIEHNQFSVWKVLPKEKILMILPKIYSSTDKLKEIKDRIKSNSITFDEINCVLAFVKSRNKKRNIIHHIEWYKRTNCVRKCYFNPEQRKECSKKFDLFASQTGTLEMTRKEFVDIFNNHLNICVLPEEEKRRIISRKEFKNRYLRIKA